MARPKTYEEMLGEKLNGGGSGGISGPEPVGGGPATPPMNPGFTPPPKPTGPSQSSPMWTTGPVTSPGLTPLGPIDPGAAPMPPMHVGPLSEGTWPPRPTQDPAGPFSPMAPKPPNQDGGASPWVTNNTFSNALNPAQGQPAAPRIVQPWDPMNPKGGTKDSGRAIDPGPTMGPISPNPVGIDPSIFPAKGTGQKPFDEQAVTNTQGQRRTANDIGALWKELTGRDATDAEKNQWGNDIDAQYYAAIRQQIASTDEAKAYAQRGQTPAAPATPPPAAAGGENWAAADFSNPDNVRRYFQSRGVTASDSSVNYWAQKYNSPEFAGDRQYFLQRLGQAEEFGGGGGEFSDPWGRALEGRVGQYDQASRERAAALAKTYQDRAAELRQPAYSSGDEAVIRAKAFDQLERRRQETLKNDREGVYARGFAPTSGLVRDATNKTNTNFEGARTGIESNLLQSSMDENQRRKDAAVQLEGLATAALNGGDLSALQALGLPLSLMNTRQQTAGSLLNGSNSQSMNSILQILAMLQQNQGANNAQAGSQAGGWGALIPILIGALGGG